MTLTIAARYETAKVRRWFTTGAFICQTDRLEPWRGGTLVLVNPGPSHGPGLCNDFQFDTIMPRQVVNRLRRILVLNPQLRICKRQKSPFQHWRRPFYCSNSCCRLGQVQHLELSQKVFADRANDTMSHPSSLDANKSWLQCLINIWVVLRWVVDQLTSSGAHLRWGVRTCRQLGSPFLNWSYFFFFFETHLTNNEDGFGTTTTRGIGGDFTELRWISSRRYP